VSSGKKDPYPQAAAAKSEPEAILKSQPEPPGIYIQTILKEIVGLKREMESLTKELQNVKELVCEVHRLV
jgi:hypothetical protein